MAVTVRTPATKIMSTRKDAEARSLPHLSSCSPRSYLQLEYLLIQQNIPFLNNLVVVVMAEKPVFESALLGYLIQEYGCLPLDCECYMLGKCWTGAYCRYFREAVLPLNPALEAALTDGPAPGLRPCAVCGRLFAPEGKRAFCSAACAENARRKRQRGYMRKRRVDC